MAPIEGTSFNKFEVNVDESNGKGNCGTVSISVRALGVDDCRSVFRRHWQRGLYGQKE